MSSVIKKKIFFLDDEPAVYKAAEQIINKLGYDCIIFKNPQDFLHQLRLGNCDLVITDIKIPGIDGITLIEKIKHIAPALPVIVISGYADIPLTVRAMKAGADDFFQKPLHVETLVNTIQKVINKTSPLVGKLLTSREKTILKLIMQGKSNKEIAYTLHRSVRTIEDHRLHIMRKLDVDNVVDLVKKAYLVESLK